MLRECLFTAEPRERNAHISKVASNLQHQRRSRVTPPQVHAWFSEKRSRSAPSGTAAAGASVAPTPRRPNRSGLAPVQRPATAPKCVSFLASFLMCCIHCSSTPCSRPFPQVTSDDPERQERRLRCVARARAPTSHACGLKHAIAATFNGSYPLSSRPHLNLLMRPL